MGKSFENLRPHLREFAEKQKMFFVATAADGLVNLSPKGMDSLRVINENRLVWLNTTGSGNQTGSHVKRNPRMTIMFCAFEGQPLVLRIFGKAKILHASDPQWAQYEPLFPTYPGRRQIFELDFDLVTTACGRGVPEMSFVAERADWLHNYFGVMSENQVKDYQERKNFYDLEGFETDLVKE